MSTKKVKRAGRFGARYGVGIRKSILKIESEQFKKHNCPNCGAPKVKRRAPGIFFCTRCDLEFAGGAYLPETMSGAIVKKMVSQKAFLPNLKELLETKEKRESSAPEKEHSEKSRKKSWHETQKSKKEREKEVPKKQKHEAKQEREEKKTEEE